MSNRLLWVLILIWVIGLAILAHLYFFVYYTSTLVIKSNVKDYKIVLEKTAKDFYNYECKQENCEIKDIAPLEYRLTISKEEYKTIVKNIKIPARNKLELEVILEKDTLLKKVEKEENKEEEEKHEETKEEKIERIKNSQKSYFFYKLDNNLGFSFILNSWMLDLNINKNGVIYDIWQFKKVDKEDISIEKIYGNKKYIFLSIWEEKYLINIENYKKTKLQITPKIKYIKSWKDEKSFILETDKWAFIYNYTKDSMEYFYLFKDFVYLDEWYIWVVYKNETEKLKNFWWEEKRNNLVIKYNPRTKDRSIVYETDLDIDMLIKNDNDEVSVFVGEDEYKLENY